MFSEAQIQYLEEVLGASVNYFQASPDVADPMDREEYPALVLTLGLTPEENILLTKILASVRLGTFHHIEVTVGQIGNFPGAARAPHTLAFFGATPAGRQTCEDSVWWSLPTLSEMLGKEASVVDKKRGTWTLLQQLAKELAR